MGHHRNTYRLSDGVMLENVAGESCRLRAKEEDVARKVLFIGEVVCRVSGKSEDPSVIHCIDEGVKGWVDFHCGEIVVVQTCPLEMRVGKIEPQGFNQVKCGAGACRQANRCTSVSGDTRFKKYDMEHPSIVRALGGVHVWVWRWVCLTAVCHG